MHIEAQLDEFRSRNYLAMPLAGLLCWSAIFVVSLLAPNNLLVKVWSYFIFTALTLPLGLVISKLFGKPMVMNWKENLIDRFFLAAIFSVIPVFIVAIVFFEAQPDSLPLTVGILTGLMWPVFSVAHGTSVGYLHALIRFTGVPIAWLLFPEIRFGSVAVAVSLAYLSSVIFLINHQIDNTCRN